MLSLALSIVILGESSYYSPAWQKGEAEKSSTQAPAPAAQTSTQSATTESWVTEEVNLYYFANPVQLMQLIRPKCTITTKYPFGDPSAETKPATQGSAASDSSAGSTSGTENKEGSTTTQPKTLIEALREQGQAVGKVSAKKDELDKIDTRIKEISKELTTISKDLKVLESEKSKREKEVSQYENRAKPLKESIESLESSIEKNDEDKRRLEKENATLDLSSESQKKTFSENEKEIAKLNRININLKKLIDQRNKELEPIETKYSEEKKQLEEATAKLDSLNAEKTSLETSLTDLKTKRNTVQGELSTATSTLATKNQALVTSRLAQQSSAQDQVNKFVKERENELIYVLEPKSSDVKSALDRVKIVARQGARHLLLSGTRDDVREAKEIISQIDSPQAQAQISLWTFEANYQGDRGRYALSDATQAMGKEIRKARESINKVANAFRDSVSEVVAEVERKDYHLFEINHHNTSRFYARSGFYAEEVRTQLGLDRDNARYRPNYYFFSKWILPDPAAVTTNAEAIMIYFLGSDRSRKKVIDLFEEKLHDSNVKTECTRFINALGRIDENKKGSKNGQLTSQQTEIIFALKRSALDRIISSAPSLAKFASDVAKNEGLSQQFGGKTREDFQREVSDLPIADEMEKMKALVSSLDSPSQAKFRGAYETTKFLLPTFYWTRSEFGLGVDNLISVYEKAVSSQTCDDKACERNMDQVIVSELRKVFPTSASNARIAAADELIKRTMSALEDDLADDVIDPMFENIRNGFKGKASLGSIEKNTVLATNRFVARVKPSATGQLDLAGEQDLINNAIALSNLYTGLQGTSIATALPILNQGQKKDRELELFGVNSGSEFKVTPIFDPSGQAFSFLFDYVKKTNVLDPDGTTQVIPRVDTHEVNTLVQISNLEIRQIAEFSGTKMLGAHERKTGGIPLLKDIWGLENVPLVGWFSRKNGRDAVTSTSYIFAQTTVYPTIKEMSSLLTGGFFVPPLTDIPTVKVAIEK